MNGVNMINLEINSPVIVESTVGERNSYTGRVVQLLPNDIVAVQFILPCDRPLKVFFNASTGERVEPSRGMRSLTGFRPAGGYIMQLVR